MATSLSYERLKTLYFLINIHSAAIMFYLDANKNDSPWGLQYQLQEKTEAVFLVACEPSMNEL